MNLLSLDQVSRSNGEKLLFKDISFGIEEGQKAALIGTNGCGKSTLFKMIMGIEKPDSGVISKNKNLKVGYLQQNHEFDPEKTIADFIFDTESPQDKILKKYELLSEKMAEKHDDQIQKEYDQLLSEMEHLKIWDYENEIHSMLKQLNINDLSQKLGQLSGGMFKKVCLAAALIGDSNLLLLDEPTNHLDLNTILWLQDFLKRTTKAVLMITHDRYFLDKVCGTLFEIDRLKMTIFKGNYSYYLDKKTEAELLMKQEDEKLESILKKELEWMKRGPKARGTKQKARIERITGMASRERYKEHEKLELSSTGRRLGGKVLEAENISISFGERKIIHDFSYFFKQGEKIGFLGPNGSGKSTLLNILSERLKPGTGKIEKGIHTHFGYFDQTSLELKPEMLLIDYIKSAAEVIQIGDGKTLTAARMLEKFLFPAILHYTPIGHLSGGEKRRLYLLWILMKNPNFLLLDEPTNDLDLKTLSVLEDYIMDFSGSLIIISHDRFFLDRTVDYLFVFDGCGNISGYSGNCSDYLEELKEEAAEEKIQAAAKAQTAKNNAEENSSSAKKAVKLSFKEKQLLTSIPMEIEILEAEKTELETFFASGFQDPEQLKLKKKRFDELSLIIEDKYNIWQGLLDKEQGS